MRDWHAGMWKKDKRQTLKCDEKKRMRKDGKKLVFIKATGSYENMGQSAGTEAGGREQGPAAHGWGEASPPVPKRQLASLGLWGRDWDTALQGSALSQSLQNPMNILVTRMSV